MSRGRSCLKRAMELIGVGAMLACFGCGRSEPAAQAPLLLHCGAGIRPAAEALIKAFEAKSGIKVTANYAGSGRLLGQISTHSKGDLYMPGAELYVDIAAQKGLADGATRRGVAWFIPALFVRKGNPDNIRSLSDLTRPGLRVDLGDPRSCAIGRRTLKLFEKNGIKRKDVMPNVVNMTATANELCQAIQLGHVAATVAWDANARNFAKYGDLVAIPRDQNLPSHIPIVVLVSSRQRAAALEFIRFITSGEAKSILKSQGYTVDPSHSNAGGDG